MDYIYTVDGVYKLIDKNEKIIEHNTNSDHPQPYNVTSKGDTSKSAFAKQFNDNTKIKRTQPPLPKNRLFGIFPW
jgi:hypothetical protein